MHKILFYYSACGSRNIIRFKWFLLSVMGGKNAQIVFMWLLHIKYTLSEEEYFIRITACRPRCPMSYCTTIAKYSLKEHFEPNWPTSFPWWNLSVQGQSMTEDYLRILKHSLSSQSCTNSQGLPTNNTGCALFLCSTRKSSACSFSQPKWPPTPSHPLSQHGNNSTYSKRL